MGPGERAELVGHLDELRGRLIVCLVAVAGGFAVAYGFHHQLIHWLNAPLPAGRQPVTFGVAEPFTTSLTVSLYAAVAVAIPVLLWQAWSFLAPALDDRIQRQISAFFGAAVGLLAAGLAFGYLVALPAAVHFLTNFDAEVYDIQVRASNYYSFVALVLLAVGIVFELPIFVLGLVRIGVLTSRTLRRKRRIGIAAVTALAVALPGVDPVTTLVEMVPLLILFEASIWLSVVFERRWASRPWPSVRTADLANNKLDPPFPHSL